MLGGLMLNDDAWFDVIETIRAEDFYRAQHQIIFESMVELAADDKPVDAVTVGEMLTARGLLERAGGLAYLGELVDSTPGTSNVGAYAKIIAEHATRRRLIGAANRIADSAFLTEGRNGDELLDQAEQELFQIGDDRLRDAGPEKANPILRRTVKAVENLFANKGQLTGEPSGFADLDKMTAGLQPGDLVIVAGRPSMGKTSLAMNMAEHVVMQSEGAVLVFSMEMGAEQLVMRMLSSLGRIDQSKMRVGDLEPNDWNGFTSAVALLKDKPLYIDDTPALMPNEVRTRARRVAKEAGGISMIVVDYLQLMRGNTSNENRTTEISEISRSLKALAREMRCPVIAAAQLNRQLENRPDKRPQMADLRESGAIEQDADVILFIYRDEVYNEASPDQGIAEIIIGKQRNGPTGKVRLSFIQKLTKFEDLASDRYDGFM